MQPHDIVEAAARWSPPDAERLLCWLINSFPPERRHILHERISSAIRDLRLAGDLEVPLHVPRLFTIESVESVWAELSSALGNLGSAINRTSAFFSPSPQHFVPHAYPGRWAPVNWNRPVSADQVRRQLQLSDQQVEELVGIARELVRSAGQLDSNVEDIGSQPDGRTELKKAKLRVAVLPYGDAMPLTALLYAISDIVEGISFGPASFYKQKAKGGSSIWIGEGFYHAGYATAYQMEHDLRIHPRSRRPVFTTGFTRSLLMRMRFPLRHEVPPVDHLSFVGQFGADRVSFLHPDDTDKALLTDRGLLFQEGFKIAEHLDPMVDWEIPLILAFASRANGFRTASGQDLDGLALTISTDAHLWSISAGLGLEPLGLIASEHSSFEPTFRRGAWDPLDERNSPSPEDRRSELYWFVPPCSDALLDSLGRLINRTILRKVSDALELVRNSRLAPGEATSLTRKQAEPLARSLLAPLLTAFPSYRGALLQAPPEAWMKKLEDSGEYIRHRPPWYRRIREELSTKDDQDDALEAFVGRAGAA